MASFTITKTIDRTGEVKALSQSYGPVAKAYADARFNHFAHLRSDGYMVLECTIPARSFLALWQRNAANPKAMVAELGKVCSEVSAGLESTSSFYGMTPESYGFEIAGQGGILRQRIETAQEEMRKSGVREALDELAVGHTRKRRRRYSDCEGSFDYSRRYEDNPFSVVEQNERELPHIELCYPIGMNCSASAEEIGRFNARCLALAEVLEGAGYRVAITAESWSVRTCGNDASVRQALTAIAGKDMTEHRTYDMCRMPLRDANEYGDIVSYAPIACAEYFRRALFSGHLGQVHYAHGLKGALKSSVDYGVGSSQDARPIPVQPGQVALDKATVNGIFSADPVIRERMFRDRILHTIKGNPREAEAS